MNNIISLSGGKDSTAMLLMMIEKKEPIHSVVFFDTGWEFPEMLEHINRLEEYVKIKFVRLKPQEPFDFLLNKKPVKSRETGKIHRLGYGWPAPLRRWRTRLKINAIEKYSKQQRRQERLLWSVAH